MDPISAAGLAAGAVQFVDTGGKALLGIYKILKDLQDTSRWMGDLLQDIEKSIEHICILRQTIEPPGSAVMVRLDPTQVQSASSKIKDAYKAAMDLKSTLEPYSRDLNSLGHSKRRRVWSAMLSVTERSNVEQKIQRVLLLNQEVSQALQVVQLTMQETIA